MSLSTKFKIEDKVAYKGSVHTVTKIYETTTRRGYYVCYRLETGSGNYLDEIPEEFVNEL